MSPPPRQKLLRKIPGVEEILSRPEMAPLLETYSRRLVVEAVRKELGRLREEILHQKDLASTEKELSGFDALFLRFQREIEHQTRLRLHRVINATGVILHTNMGRSLLHPSAIEHLADVSKHYSNLELDVESGERGSRYDHVEEILCRLTGAESAMVVNNNAGAVLLVLNTLAEGKEVIVSRGELVEIGGAFRIPDVMKRSGASLREVGTTNRTHLSDYQKAVNAQTALILKVHTSNFRVMGFTAEVDLEDIVRLGKKRRLPVINDLGSGCLIDLTRYGLEKEPTVQEMIKTGVDAVTISGDKLLGGPQAGIILGKKKYLKRFKANPLTRALRIDKLTLAALESTLLLYLDEKKAVEEIPTLKMLTTDVIILKERGERLLEKITGCGIHEHLKMKGDMSQVGGGALPLQKLPTIVITMKPPSGISASRLEEKLREGNPPVISRISKNELILDMRTVLDEEIPLLAEGIKKALQ